VRYVVSLTIAKGDRSATASKSITPTATQQGVVGEVVRSCGVDVGTGQHLPCPSSHNPTDPLTLIVVPEINAPFDMEVSVGGCMPPAFWEQQQNSSDSSSRTLRNLHCAVPALLSRSCDVHLHSQPGI
jgi:hypothetical protein